ncbi:MAG: D-alanine--D-alanine ligase [Hyphomicrobiales bacterium]
MSQIDVHVAVLMGGWSAEREVSLDSGEGCAGALERAGYRVTRVDVKPDIAQVLSDLKPDVAFNALHGRWGEDGCVQGVLEILQIPYTHSGVLASSLAMHKEKAKEMYRSVGIPTAQAITADRMDAGREHLMTPPYVVKPVAEGSSVGVLIVEADQEHPPQELFREDWPYGDEVMIERFIPGRELTCAVMGDQALDIIDVIAATKFYDYEAKYAPGGSEHILPAVLSEDIYARIQAYSLSAHQVLGCRGVSRSDYRFDEGSGELIILETNTQPGMTGTSLVPEMAAHAGYSYEQLVDWMVKDASCDR